MNNFNFMRRSLLLFCSLSFIFSCISKKESVPENIISKEKMISVLLDVHLLESSINLSYIKPQLKGNDTTAFYNVFKNNNITKTEYEESLVFYKSRPKLLNEIYDSVLVKISLLESEEKKGGK